MEVWKKLHLSDDYEISNLGNIRSLDRYRKSARGNGKKIVKGKLLKHQNSGNGYIKVTIKLNGEYKNCLIHRALAIAFIPNPENKPCVNHINGIKSDNRIDNLEWVTYKENTIHAVKTGLQVAKSGNRTYMYGRKYGLHHNAKKVIDTETGIVYDCAKEVAHNFGILYNTLANCLNGHRKNTTKFKYI